MRAFELQKLVTISGTFVGVHLTSDSISKLLNWIEQNNISGSITPANDFHATLIQDKEKEIPWNAQQYNPPIRLDPNTYYLDLFGLANNILVLGFKSNFLQKKHQLAKKLHNISWDFDVYNPHITLARNVINFDPTTLPPYFPIYLSGEYADEYRA
jgi:2'-5' RNA ligase